ncbi:MAG: RidA family protein [Thermoleophilia bacterium]
MSLEAPQPQGMSRPIAPYSPVIVSDDLVLLSGQIPFDENNTLVSEDFEPQARQVFENIRRCLEAAGCNFEHVLKVTTYLKSFEDFETYNSLYAHYFTAPYPARTTVQAGLYGFRIEIDAIARRPEQR